ncbi:hypothetical protein MAPG_02364 [Magnaporthiopsis poae ATCC 64411]|uniref:Uncharacterized protein n=1 Tax=Magnaporthiopsis poae (strain ATCC 64411 / 73-15) TaxID=644358 RepID=A0A0C4DR61_MAGP6|nr:hypothetical protein MAPG_02364 [Magnaporthiopsis poae ATCC 64411]
MTRTNRNAEPSDLEDMIGALMAAGDEKDTLIEDLKTRLSAAEARLDALKNRPAKHVELDRLQLATQANSLAYSRNVKITADTDRLSPIYSSETGEPIALCPKTVADLMKMDASELKPLLEALGTLPLDRTDQEMREAVANHMCVPSHILALNSKGTD